MLPNYQLLVTIIIIIVIIIIIIIIIVTIIIIGGHASEPQILLHAIPHRGSTCCINNPPWFSGAQAGLLKG